MKRTFLTAFALLLAASAFAQQTERYIIGTRSFGDRGVRPVLQEIGELGTGVARDIAVFETVQAFAAELTAEQVVALRKSPNVRYVEPDYEVHALADSVNKGAQTTPYGVGMVNVAGVWPVTRGTSVGGGSTVHVAVMDTGLTYDHPELIRAYKGGWNAFTESADPLDDNGHGTHVAGTIAAADDSEGIVGVAPEVELYAVKVLNSCGRGTISSILKGIDWVVQKKMELGGNWIMSLSLGGLDNSNAEREAFQKAADAGILSFAASGNGYPHAGETIGFPAGLPTVVAVGAVDDKMEVASFSQRGPELKLVAPGVSVLSTLASDHVATDDGRSYGSFQLTAFTDDTSGEVFVCLPRSKVSGQFVIAGVGNTSDFPSDTTGKIALIQRDGTDPAGTSLTFSAQAKNAKAAGAIAAVIYDNGATENTGWFIVIDTPDDVALTVGITQADGNALKATPNATLTLDFGMPGYALLEGTSMATPHVSAVAALVWAAAPNATAEQVKSALINTAKDLGASGFDNTYGFGLVNALEAARNLAPERFRSGQTPTPTKPTRRRSVKRS